MPRLLKEHLCNFFRHMQLIARLLKRKRPHVPLPNISVDGCLFNGGRKRWSDRRWRFLSRRTTDMADVGKIAANTMIFGLTLVEKVSECVPVPGIRAAAGGLNIIINGFETASHNLHDLDDLIHSIDKLDNLLSMFEDTSTFGRGLTDDLGEQLFMLSCKLHKVKQNLKNIEKHSKLRRIIESGQDAAVIMRQFRQIQLFIHEIIIGSALKAEVRLADLYALEHLDKLPRAKDARHDYVNRPLCTAGTRAGVLSQIMHWVHNTKSQQIYWLNGAAGTGKTTIALTIADILSKDSNIFSASFFCSRESEGRSDARLIFPTLAHVFARCDVRLRNRIVQVIKEIPDIGHALPAEQLQRLIIEPLQKADSKRQIVIVLDALDECTGGRAPEIILTALASVIKSVPFLKVFVSSRATAATNDAFSFKTLSENREVFVLHDVQKDVVDADIRDYMVDRLKKKAALRRLCLSPWPPEALIVKLVRMAGGLFIFASTVCEFIEARGDLDFRLREIANRSTRDYTGIDGLYKEILEHAIAEFPDNLTIQHCRTIIGTIIMLQDPLSCHDLGVLLRLPPNHIHGILGDLQSVISVSSDIHECIRTLHASFHDFISTKERCLPSMYLEPSPQHRMLTFRSLEIMMDGLKRNMSYLIRFKLNKTENVPGYLRYACRFWADHLSATDHGDADELLMALSKFASTKLTYCLEVLDCLGDTSDLSNETLIKAERWLSIFPDPPVELIRKLRYECISNETPSDPSPSLFELFGLSPDTRYAQRGYGRLCVEGTRNEVLEDILAWVNDDANNRLFWLNGAAGTGKTTIARTVANLVGMDRSQIAASFFCSRYSRYRNDAQNIFVSLSIQLAMRCSSFRVHLVDAARQNPDIARQPPSDQFQVLIKAPLDKSGLVQKPIIFVLDALDECKGGNGPQQILSALECHIHEMPFLKVLISNRPSLPMSQAFQCSSIPSSQFCLQDADRALVDADIERYLREVLCSNASIVERLSVAWPPDALVEKLVSKSGGLFIYASFIATEFILVGTGKLEAIANHPGSEYEGNLGLNVFYGRILRSLIKDKDEQAQAQWRKIFGTLTHLLEPISEEGLAEILRMEIEVLHKHLLAVQSLVLISRNLVRPIHISWQDWITDEERSLPELFINPSDMHREIALRLIDCMVNGLEKGPADDGYITGDVAGKSGKSMPIGSLDYACRHWAQHLTKTTADHDLRERLEIFMKSKCMLWIERLEASGLLMVAASALEDVRTWYHEVSQPRHEYINKFFEAQQLILERSVMASGVLE